MIREYTQEEKTMIEKWLKKNKVKVKEVAEPKDSSGLKMRGEE